MDAITAAYDGDVQMIDSTSDARASARPPGQKKGGVHHMGRSRGRLSTKIHALVDRWIADRASADAR